MYQSLGILLLTGALIGAHGQSTHKTGIRKASPKSAAAATSKKSGAKAGSQSAGMMAYKDPETGEFIATPPSSTAKASSSAKQAAAVEKDAEPTITYLPDGSVKATLPESMMVNMVATRNPDGTITISEGHGKGVTAQAPKKVVKEAAQ